MKFEMDIDKAITLVNKKTFTVDNVCKFLFSVVEDYQNYREDFHMKQLQEKYVKSSRHMDKKSADEIAEEVAEKIENDVRNFVPSYVDESIDKVLDAMNQKKFKTKKASTALLILLTTLKENYEEKS